MAIAARQVRVAAAEDGIVAVEREVVMDPDTGIAAEVEKVTVAVDVGGGQIAVAEQQRVIGYNIGRQAQSRPAIQAHPHVYYDPQPSERKGLSPLLHFVNCLICLIFPPWIICWCICCCLAADQESGHQPLLQ